MPFVAPRFSSNNTPSSIQHVPAPINRPPWLRGPVPSSNNSQQGNNAPFVPPWRKNIRRLPSDPNSSTGDNSVPVVVSSPEPVAVVHEPPAHVFQAASIEPETKTSVLKINLRPVKKSESGRGLPTALPHPAVKAVPLPSLVQERNKESSSKKNKKVSPVTETIPIQLPRPSEIPILRPKQFEIPIIRPKQSEIPIQRPKQTELPVLRPKPLEIPIQQSNQSEVPGQLPERAEIQKSINMPKATSGGGPPPPAPPPPPNAPPPPPPPANGLPPKIVKIEQLKKAPKRRPDWAGMMKEIEKGRKLNHVDCNDRSKPILTRLKSHGKFVYESEAKPANKSEAIHNKLLNQITQGVKLKKVKCNDRSKPILTGLRVRRQSSVAEGDGIDGTQAALLEPVTELAFLDIDDLRDELQSAKQMLQTEVDAKHNLERKTRDQKCQIISMEAEIETLKAKLGIIPEDEVSILAKSLEKSDSKILKHLKKSGSSLWKSPSSAGLKKSKSGLAKSGASDVNVNKLGQEDDLTEMNEYEEEIVSLKEAVQHAKQQADDMEAKYKEAMDKLQAIQTNLEDSEQKRTSLEKQVENLQAQQDGTRPIAPVVQTAERTTQTEEQILEKTASLSRQQSTMSNAGGDESESEEEQESDIEVDDEAIQKKKQERELKLWENKVKSVKDKQNTSRLERKNLKNLQKKLEAELKEANKRHKKLQKEVDKMAKMLKEAEKDSDDEDEDEEEEEEAAEDGETEEEESEEEESESEEEEVDESSEEDDAAGTYDDRLVVFGRRVKKKENLLNALRKGNYLLRANIDRLKDELEEARIAYHDLEHELNAVLDET